MGFQQNKIYTENKRCLESRFPRIHSKLTKKEKQLQRISSHYQFFQTENNLTACSIKAEDTSFALTSRINPERSASRFVDQVFSEDVEAYVMVGLGLGYEVKALLQKISKGQRVIVLEPEWELFFQQMKYISLKDLLQHEQFALLVEEKDERALDALRILFWKEKIKSFSFLTRPVYQTLFSQFCNRIKGLVLEDKLNIDNVRKRFSVATQEIKKDFFIEDQMKDVQQFFERIEEQGKSRSLNEVETSYLFIRNLLKFQSYEEKLPNL